MVNEIKIVIIIINHMYNIINMEHKKILQMNKN